MSQTAFASNHLRYQPQFVPDLNLNSNRIASLIAQASLRSAFAPFIVVARSPSATSLPSALEIFAVSLFLSLLSDLLFLSNFVLKIFSHNVGTGIAELLSGQKIYALNYLSDTIAKELMSLSTKAEKVYK